VTIYRLPVVVSATDLTPLPDQLPPKLQCEDFDASGNRTGSACQHRFEISGGGRYKCGKGCRQGAFLYPRSYKGADKVHHHQGIDIASGRHGATIVSVCDGVVDEAVAKEFVSGVGGYGRTIVIRSETEKRWYLYAHCFEVFVEKGNRVLAGQAIGTVGISDTWKNKETGKTYIFDGSDESRAHLHFEVSASSYFKKQYTAESRPDDFVPGATPKDACRLDPLAELERLGPWGMRQIYVPTGREVNESSVALTHTHVETSSLGGYFPLGANNLWHGGVHLGATPRSTLLAPLDGTIVAARLDPAPDPDRMAFGSTNFIVLRHEIPQGVYDRFQGKTSPSGGGGDDGGDKKKKPPSVGKKCTNPPELVVKVKRRLAILINPQRMLPYYLPDDPARVEDGECDAELVFAIRSFQDDIPGRTWKIDGKMTVGATTWRALFPEDDDDDDDDDPSTPDEPPPPESDTPRTLWTVLMHLSAETLDGELAKTVPWLANVELAPDPMDDAEVEAAKTRDAHAEDVAEAAHPFVGPVPGGSAADIEWVQKRLKRLADYGGEVNGIYDDNLEAALRSFQEQRTKYYGKAANQPAPGTVNAVDPKAKKNKSETLAALRKTRRELGLDPAPSVDPVLALRLSKHGVDGTARVVTGLGVKVKSGDPIWLSGHGRGLDESDELAPHPAVHWEMFTTDPLVAHWPQLDDDSNDLTVDVPMLVEDMEIDDGGGEFAKDGLLTPAELVEFYASGRGQSMRVVQCRFRSEWGLEIGPAVARIDELGLDTDGLAEELAPYMWWSEAGDAVPASPIVWHYNPIELVGLYQSILDGMMPKPIERMGSLHVTVVYEDGASVVGTVKISANGYDVVASAWLTGSEGGNAAFDEIAPDSYIVYLDGFEEHAVEVEVPPDTTVPVMVFLPGF
jgi:peptidoglycan hydrolase-like protein with peptidoglycan-binding domain